MHSFTPEQIEARTAEIRKKRIATLVGTYDLMREKMPDIRSNTSLHYGIVATTVEDYLRDRAALVNRHNVPNRIQRHKIAGLMAAAIVKNKPIQITNFDESTNERISKDNEYLAVVHGLAVCAEGRLDRVAEMRKNPVISDWWSDFIYLLHRHPSNTESFILIFQTLSLHYFPENLTH